MQRCTSAPRRSVSAAPDACRPVVSPSPRRISPGFNFLDAGCTLQGLFCEIGRFMLAGRPRAAADRGSKAADSKTADVPP